MRAVGKALWRKGSAACSERTKSDNVETEAFLDRQRKSSEKMGNGGVSEDKEGVKNAAPRRDSRRKSEHRRVLRRISGTREEKKAKRLDGGAEMKARGAMLAMCPDGGCREIEWGTERAEEGEGRTT